MGVTEEGGGPPMVNRVIEQIKIRSRLCCVISPEIPESPDIDVFKVNSADLFTLEL